jgi:hypothetical protein
MSLEARSSQSGEHGQGHGGGQSDPPGGGQENRLVEITINGGPFQIARGRHSVAEIKALGNVPPADDLEQVIDGQLTPLPDDGHVVIRGGEVFVSHPKSGCAS